MLGDIKLRIYTKNPAIHFATLDFKMFCNGIDSPDSKIKHLQRTRRNRVCLEGTELLLCRAWELSNWDSNKHNTDTTDKDRSCTSQTRTDRVLFPFLQEEQLDLVMTWTFRAHLHFIQENDTLFIVEVPCSGCILNIVADSFTAPSKAVGQHPRW